jgi:drug/metabolite transporter (DMT)-like permease
LLIFVVVEAFLKGFPFSILKTNSEYNSAAVTLLLVSLNLLWASVIGKIVLKDSLPLRTYTAIILAFGCMLIILVPEMASNKEGSNVTTSFAAALTP